MVRLAGRGQRAGKDIYSGQIGGEGTFNRLIQCAIKTTLMGHFVFR